MIGKKDGEKASSCHRLKGYFTFEMCSFGFRVKVNLVIMGEWVDGWVDRQAIEHILGAMHSVKNSK